MATSKDHFGGMGAAGERLTGLQSPALEAGFDSPVWDIAEQTHRGPATFEGSSPNQPGAQIMEAGAALSALSRHHTGGDSLPPVIMH